MRKELSFEINKQCNFRCSFCYTEKYREDLPEVEKVFDIIEQGIAEGVDSISMTGGEPLLQSERVVQIAQFAKSKGLSTRLNSNGILLVPGADTELLIKLIDEFQISFNAVGDGPFAKYTGVKESLKPFSTILSNIQYLLDMDANVSIRFTLDGDTAHSLSNVYKLLTALTGIQSGKTIGKFKVRVSVPAGDAPRIEPHLQQLQSAVTAFFDDVRLNPRVPVQFKDGSRKLYVPVDIKHVFSPSCICGEGSIHISSDLRHVSPCVFVRDTPSYQLGELRSTESSLRDVWSRVSSHKFMQLVGEPTSCASHTAVDGIVPVEVNKIELIRERSQT
jgi:MoaA/NifB/PqqE/SkfB family radical SAM enzyme